LIPPPAACAGGAVRCIGPSERKTGGDALNKPANYICAGPAAP